MSNIENFKKRLQNYRDAISEILDANFNLDNRPQINNLLNEFDGLYNAAFGELFDANIADNELIKGQTQEIVKLQLEVDTLTNKNYILNKEKEELNASVTSGNEENKNLKDSILELNKKIEELTGESTKLTEKLNSLFLEAESAVKTLQKEKEDQTEEYNKKLEQIKKYMQSESEKNMENEAKCKNEIDELVKTNQETVIKYTNEIKNMLERYRKQQAEHTEDNKRNYEEQKRVDNLNYECTRDLNECKKLKLENEKSIKTLEHDLSRSKSSAIDLSFNLQNCKQEVAGYKKEIESLNEKIENGDIYKKLNEKITYLDQLYTAEKAKLDLLDGKKSSDVIKDLIGKVKAYEDNHMKLVEYSNSVKADTALCKRELKNAQQLVSNYKDIENEMEKIKKKNTELSSEMKLNQKAIDNYANLEAKYKSKAQNVVEMQKKMEELEKNYQTILSIYGYKFREGMDLLEFEKYIDDCNKKEEIIKEHKMTIDNNKSEITKLKNDIEKNEANLQEHKKQLEEAKSKINQKALKISRLDRENQADKDKSDEAIKKVEEERNKLNMEVETLKTQISELNLKGDECEKKAKENEKGVNDLLDKNSKLETILLNVESEKKRLEAENLKLIGQLDSNASEDKSYKALLEMYENINKEYKELIEVNMELTNQKEKYLIESRNLKDANSELTKATKALNNNLLENSRTYEKSISVLEEKINSLKNNLGHCNLNLSNVPECKLIEDKDIFKSLFNNDAETRKYLSIKRNITPEDYTWKWFYTNSEAVKNGYNPIIKSNMIFGIKIK